MNGVGTLIFIAVTKGQAPAYLGSSFAFLAPAGIVIAEMGYEYALGGFVAVGFCGCVLSFIIYKCGTDWIDIVLPPAAMGPVVALIGLELSGSAASNAGLLDLSLIHICVSGRIQCAVCSWFVFLHRCQEDIFNPRCNLVIGEYICGHGLGICEFE